MSKADDAQTIREVSERIDSAIARNQYQERIIVAVLLALFAAGLALIVWGASTNRLALLVPGGILKLTVAYPVRSLIKLPEANMRLQIIPQLLRLAEIKDSKALAVRLIKRLIDQVQYEQ